MCWPGEVQDLFPHPWHYIVDRVWGGWLSCFHVLRAGLPAALPSPRFCSFSRKFNVRIFSKMLVRTLVKYTQGGHCILVFTLLAPLSLLTFALACISICWFHKSQSLGSVFPLTKKRKKCEAWWKELKAPRSQWQLNCVLKIVGNLQSKRKRGNSAISDHVSHRDNNATSL